MKALDLQATERCGGHIHLGADYLTTLEEYKEFFEIYGNAEKIIYLISNKPGELPRESIRTYAKPVSEILENEIYQGEENKFPEPTEKDEFIMVAQEIQDSSKEYSINIMNINEQPGKNTIEFRGSNGTIDGDVWVENIKLYARIMQSAKEIARIKEKHKNGEELTEEEQRKIVAKYKLKHEDSDDDKMENLMELLFDKNEREVYLQRYNTNKELAEKEGFFKDLTFGKVDCREMFVKAKDEQKEEIEGNER